MSGGGVVVRARPVTRDRLREKKEICMDHKSKEEEKGYKRFRKRGNGVRKGCVRKKRAGGSVQTGQEEVPTILSDQGRPGKISKQQGIHQLGKATVKSGQAKGGSVRKTKDRQTLTGAVTKNSKIGRTEVSWSRGVWPR